MPTVVGRRSAFRGSLLLVALVALSGTGSAADPEKPSTKPGEMYGDQGGEKVAPGNARLPNTVMRARLEDTFFKLSNPRLNDRRTVILVDYEVVSRGKFEGGAIVVRTAEGNKSEVYLKTVAGRDSGTIQLVAGSKFEKKGTVAAPQNVEMYVTRGDERYDPPLRYMVSNAVVLGKMKTATRPRDWSPDEIKQYAKGPPAYKNPNAHTGVGEDVPAFPAGGGQSRFVAPAGRLLGLDYHIGDWDKRKAVWRLTPVFSLDQPKQHSARSAARKGYAVAGAEVTVDKDNYLKGGIRLLFGRVKADGTLDAKDAYAGEWIGPPPTGEATKLVNDGRRVMGIHIQQGAITDRFALVVEEKDK